MKKLKNLLLAGALCALGALALAVGARLVPDRQVVVIDPQAFLNQQVEHVQGQFAVLDFYDSRDPAGVAHLEVLRRIVRDRYADRVQVIPVDIADAANLAAVKTFLSRDVWEKSMPYTLLVQVMHPGAFVRAGNLFIPQIFHTPEVQIREVFDTVFKADSK